MAKPYEAKSKMESKELSVMHEGGEARVDDGLLCTVLLAAGRSPRNSSIQAQTLRDTLPKPYWRFGARRSILEHAYARIDQLVPPDRVFTVVNEADLKHSEVSRQISARMKHTIVVQPEDRDTGPELLLPLTYLHKRFPTSVAAVIPPEQFSPHDDRLIRYIRLAQVVVRHDPSKLILLGTKPDDSEGMDYGYVLRRPERNFDGWGTYQISHFFKPFDVTSARWLRDQGAPRNSMLLVMQPQTLFLYVQVIAPTLARHFDRIEQSIGTGTEAGVIRKTYSRLNEIDFSKELLEPITQKFPGSLLVLPVGEWTESNKATDTANKLATISRLGHGPAARRQQPTSRASKTDKLRTLPMGR